MSDALHNGRPATRRGRAILRALERIFAWCLAFMLLASSFAHLGNPYYFLSTVYSYRLTGIVLGEAVGLILPYVQLVLAACLVMRRWTAEAYLLGTVMFATFLAAQAAVLGRGDTIPCGCFGPSDDSAIGIQSLLVAGLGAVLTVAGWLCATVYLRTALPTPPASS